MTNFMSCAIKAISRLSEMSAWLLGGGFASNT
jgi:hypothetical protein